MEKQWILDMIEQLARFGETERGTTRLAFSAADFAAREYMKERMQEAGLAVRIDPAGNIIGRLEGTDRAAAAVATGSHLDTAPDAGKYDGVLGVVGALAALKRLRERGPLRRGVEMIVFVAEESSRFGVATVGSQLMAGQAGLKAFGKIKDQRGVSLAQCFLEQGATPESLAKAARGKDEIKAFVELHIDQSGFLASFRKKIGIVESVAAPAKCKIKVEGAAAHSASQAMHRRRDALVSAAMIVLAINGVALRLRDAGVLATVGVLNVYPGVMNVVPGEVEMWVDIRGKERANIVECLQEIKDAVSEITESQETRVSIVMLSSDRPMTADAAIVETIEAVCRKRNVSCQKMDSMATHDAMSMARIAASGMIFVPCSSGVGRHAAECVEPDDIMNGVGVLTDTLYALAK